MLSAASLFALRVTPAHHDLSAVVVGNFTEGSGWYPGEPLRIAHPVRAWGSWSGDDANTGALTIGPLAAPERLRLAVSGYPTQAGIECYAEHLTTKARIKLESADVGERWRILDVALPVAWRGESIVVVAVDHATQPYGWIGITEPIRGGAGDATATVLRLLSVWSWGALAFLALARAVARNVPLAPREPFESRPTTTPSPLRRWAPWLAGVAALIPFIWCASTFRDVWWFGDEWDQLDQIARQGFWRWTVRPFGENVVPLFKALWGGVALMTGGSYFPMLAVVWLTHAVNTTLLAGLLRRVGLAWPGTALACALFALPVANAEVLAWSVQWSNVLAVLFLLLALDRFFRERSHTAAPRSSNLVIALLAAASALTFVRGILTSLVLAIGAVCVVGDRMSFAARARAAAVYVAPTAAVIVWMFLAAPGNHHDLGRESLWGKSLEFAAYFWAAVPFHRLLEVGTWDGAVVVSLGLLKLSVIAWALQRTRGAPRHLLILLLLFDLGNAVLLGIGRHHTGLVFANSSRYYYNSLVCVVPFLAVLCNDCLGLIGPPRWRLALATVVIAVAGLGVARKWPMEAESFAAGRGRNTRQVLLRDPAPPAEGAVPGIPFLRTQRAKELIEIYHLH
jgi:hypothetical protein